MTMLEEPIRHILMDFCHVEWYEVDELITIVNSGAAKFNVTALRQQFESLLSRPHDIVATINKLTANEFESDEEARFWLEKIYRRVFH